MKANLALGFRDDWDTRARRSGHYIDFLGNPHLVEQSKRVVVDGMRDPVADAAS